MLLEKTKASARGYCCILFILLVALQVFKPVIMASLPGGKRQVNLSSSNTLEIDELANFAVNEHNNQQNSLQKLSFSKVVSAQTQVVQGTMYHLVIEVEEASKTKQYQAKVWVKPWENFKKLEEFKPMGGPLGVLRSCGPPLGLQNVPTDDLVVQEAAEHVLKMLQLGSNSLAAYKLSEVVSAQAAVKDDSTHFTLLLKTKRGTKEEYFKTEIHRTVDGKWHAALR